MYVMLAALFSRMHKFSAILGEKRRKHSYKILLDGSLLALEVKPLPA